MLARAALFASAGFGQVVHAVAVEIADKLRRSAQQRTVIAKLLVDILIGDRGHGRLA
jgi:hydroxypyruvate isomerase